MSDLYNCVSEDQLAAITHGQDKEQWLERIAMPAGPRKLPAWVRDAHVDFREGWANSPDIKVRCRTDPLAFTDDDAPVWERLGKDGWIAEHEGVARVHYHSGAVRETEFEEHVRWIVPPSRENMWKGEAEKRKYTMLATTKQDGYGGRHFDIVLRDGTPVRLRGPWHGGAPEGFTEVYYDTDEHLAKNGRFRNRPKWYQQGGFFGLVLRHELLLDIVATYQPHLRWGWVTTRTRDGERRVLEPLRPETDLPKGWYVKPSACPGHRFDKNVYGGEDKPWDRCSLCNQSRDPEWSQP